MEMLITKSDEEFIIKVVELALQNGLNLRQNDSFGSGLLHRATVEGRLRVVEWLAIKEVCIGGKNANGQTCA